MRRGRGRCRGRQRGRGRCTPRQAHTQSYLGAMNTCPSDSKLLGSRYSKSATEREGYPAGRGDRDAGGPGGRETDRERGEGTTTKKKRHLLLLVTREERKGRSAVAGTAREGTLQPNRERFAHLGLNLLGHGLQVVAYAQPVACTQGHTDTHTYIYARTCIYMHVWEGVGASLSRGGGEGRELHAALLARGGSPEHLVVGEKKKKEFSGINMAKQGTLPTTVQPEAARPTKSRAMRCRALPQTPTGALPPQAGGTPMGMEATLTCQPDTSLCFKGEVTAQQGLGCLLGTPPAEEQQMCGSAHGASGVRGCVGGCYATSWGCQTPRWAAPPPHPRPGPQCIAWHSQRLDCCSLRGYRQGLGTSR